jgi:hypothetical protein
MAHASSGVAVTDPWGRSVVLSVERWEHITTRHPELRPYRADVLAAVRRPTSRIAGRRPDEEWFYRRDAGPSRWLKVVVAYEGAVGEIRTAFARRALP